MLEPKIDDQSSDTRNLGLLHEAVNAFLRQDCLDSFWQCVCENARRLIPAGRMCIVLQSDQTRCEVMTRLERGKILPPLEQQFDIDRDLISSTLRERGVGWFTAPWEKVITGLREDEADQADPLRCWLVQDEPEAILTAPIQVNGENVGAIMFVLQTVDPADQTRLRSLALGYALHVGTTYTMLRTTAKLAVANQNLEAEIAERKQAEAALQDHREHLQKLVDERAGELATANQHLHREIEERKKTEQALRQSEERFRVIAEATPAPLLISRLEDGVILYANPSFRARLGYRGETLLGSQAPQLYKDPADRQRIIEAISQTGSLRNYEAQIRKADGTPFWATIFMEIVTFEGEQVLFTVAQDITERKQAEKELQDSEARYRLLADYATDMISTHTPAGDYLYVSPACRTLLGYEPAELVGCSSYEFFHPADLDRIKQSHEAIMSEVDIYTVTYRIRPKTGPYIWFETTGRVIRDHKSGQVEKIIAVSRDVTKRKQAEEALLKSEERYRIVSELTSDYAYAFQIDRDGQLTLDWITGAFTRITGFTREELAARGGWLALIHPDDLPAVQARSQRVLAGLADISEFRIVAKNEETRWLRDHSRPLWDDARERAIAIYGACQDVTERKQTEAALRESEKKFRTLTETTAAGIIIHQGREFLYVNPAAEAITGYSRTELLTMKFWDIIHPDFRSIITERAEARLQGQASLSNYEVKISTKSGANRWIYLTAGIIEYRGQPAILATAFDITERKTAAEALQKIAVENVRLARAVDAAAEGVSISDPNQPGNPLIYVNPAFSQITGYSPDECIGQNCRFLQGPETDPAAVTRIREALTEQQEVQVTILNYRKDGQPFWNQLRISPVISKTGQLLYFVGLQSDITQRKQAEKALKESEDRLRTVMEKMPNGVSVTVQERLVYVNPAIFEMSGYSPAELLGQSPLQFFHPEEREQVAARLQKIMQSGLESAARYRLLKKDGEILPVEIASRPIQFGGEPAILSILHDLTERKRAEEALIYARDQALEANRLKTQLLATVSHELRTPLNAILGFTEILDFGVYGPLTAKQRETLGEIMDSTHYLTGLVNELLDQAQLEAGKVTLNIAAFAPAELVNQVRARMSVLAETKGLRLIESIAPDAPETVAGDRERVQQILLNLVSNAIKFTEQGHVEMKVQRPSKEQWAMIVSDTGLGIADSAQTQIFEPFHQIDASITRRHRGSGLGLSIVKQLIHLMGGQITVESQEGQGSTFTVLLPIRPRRRKPAS